MKTSRHPSAPRSTRATLFGTLAAILLTMLAGLGGFQAAAVEIHRPAEPRVARSAIPLASHWRFQIDAADIGEKENWSATDFDRTRWGQVEVPKAWDLFDEAMWGYEGVGWFATEIAPDQVAPSQVQLLKFGRVNYHTKVWLNGEVLGENVNGYLPFAFEVTGRLRSNQPNQLIVRVDNAPRLLWLPGAKKIEWMLYGGILEPVLLETLPRVFVSDLSIHAVPHDTGAQVEVLVEVTSRTDQPSRGELQAVAEAGRPASVTFMVAPGEKSIQKLSLALSHARPWSPEEPNLHELTVNLQAGPDADVIRTRFGIRKVEVLGRDILINGRKFMAKGVNRYDEYGRYGPRPPRELLVADLQRMKRAGVNMIRVHYPQSPELLSLYDELGFVLSEEVPINWWGNGFSGRGEEVLDERILGQARPALERMIQRDKNHPCVIIWSMANESQTAKPAGIAVMRQLLRRAKELDASRLVTFVTSTEDAKPHAAYEDADLVAINVYAGVFSRDLSLHINDLAERVTRPTADHIRRQLAAFPNKPFMVTEFGTRGFPGMHGDVIYTEEHQAALIEAAWRGIESCSECSGGVLWCWADYYHRRTFNDNGPFGCFGVVTVDRRPKAALDALTKMFGGKP